MDHAAPGPIYRADPPGGLVVVPLDAFTAVYHRRSGMTHLLTEPAPQILAILGDAGLSLDRLAEDYDLADATASALAARLDELVAHVVIHEIGHHFGLSDDDMHALEIIVAHLAGRGVQSGQHGRGDTRHLLGRGE